MKNLILALGVILYVSKTHASNRYGKSDILRLNYNVIFLDIGKYALELSNNGGITFDIRLLIASDLRVSDKTNVNCDLQFTLPLLDLPANEFANLNHYELLEKFDSVDLTGTAYEGINVTALIKNFFDSCLALQSAFGISYERLDASAQKIDMLRDAYKLAIQSADDNENVREKRFLSLVSKGISYWFGLARSKDLNSVREAVQLLQESSSNSNALLNELHSSVSKITEKHNHAVQKLSRAQALLASSFIDFESRFSTMLRNLQLTNKRILYSELAGIGDLADVTLATNNLIWKLDTVQKLHHKLEMALRDLSKNRLPHSLITYKDLESSLSLLKNKIQTSFPEYTFISLPLSYFYTTGRVISHTIDNTLYISLNVPLNKENHPSIFILYRIIKVESPISRTRATTLSTPYEFLGVSINEEYAILLTSADFLMCEGIEFLHCRNILLIQRFETVECFYALYFDIQERVLEECNFHIKRHNIEHGGIYHLQDYLITNKFSPPLQLNCDNSTENIDSCLNLCLFQLQCNCTVISADLAFPNFEKICVNDQQSIKLYNSINLPLLSLFKKKSTFSSIFGNTFYLRNQKESIPSIDQEELNKLLASINDTLLPELPLKKLNNNSFLSKQKNIPSWTSWHYVLLAVLTIDNLLILCFWCLLCYLLHKYFAFAVLLSQLKLSQGLIQEYSSRPTKASVPPLCTPSNFSNMDHPNSKDHFIALHISSGTILAMAVCGMVSMYLLLTMIIKKYTSILRVYLRIYSKNQQFSVCVSCIKNFNLSSLNFPGNTVIKYACISYFRCVPYLEIKYSKGNLLMNNFPLIFPDKILLFLHQVKKVRSIIKHKFNSEFLVALDDQVLGIFGA